jgi:hypothetical protein
MASTQTIIIKPFIGGKHASLNYREWIEMLQGVALRVPTPNESTLNLYGFIVSDEEWADSPLVKQRKLGAFAQIPHPGACDPEPEDTYGNRLKIQDILMRRHMDENNALLAFTTALLNALDEPSRRLLADAGGGTAILTKSIQEIMAILNATYAKMPSNELAYYAHQLTVPYIQGADVMAFFSNKTELHRILALHQETIAPPRSRRSAWRVPRWSWAAAPPSSQRTPCTRSAAAPPSMRKD